MKRIHIVSFDNPFPPNYGGVIDVHGRIQAFLANGWQVELHCFIYGREERPEGIENLTIHHYHRHKTALDLLSSKPFITKTRWSQVLANTLSNTTDPVLLEGLHCAEYLKIASGKFWLRTHNVEHDYYSALANENSGFKRFFLRTEALKLKKYERIVSKAKGILSISQKDEKHFKHLNPNTYLFPSFFTGKLKAANQENYMLFQGNLSVSENENALRWLVENVWDIGVHPPLIAAGKKPSSALKDYLNSKGVEVVESPSLEKMEDLLSKAKVHLLYSEQDTGFKLKLLASMGTKGHVICSSEFLSYPGIEKHILQADSSEEFKKEILSCLNTCVSDEILDKRWAFLHQEFSPEQSFVKLEKILLS
jgi:hypothetical protein